MSVIPPPPPPPMKEKSISSSEEPPMGAQATKNYLLAQWKAFYGGHYDKFAYTHILPIIQQGPTCGLTALAMASTTLRQPVSPEAFLEAAKDMGFTSKGEMFVARELQALADTLLASETTSELYTDSLGYNSELVIHELKTGNLILVPYDADKNNYPFVCCGHKAHWAVLCGVILRGSEVFVIARQGKSKFPAIWDLSVLDESNINLLELGPNQESTQDYDLKKTLASHFIVLRVDRDQ